MELVIKNLLKIYYCQEMDFKTVEKKHGIPILPGDFGARLQQELQHLKRPLLHVMCAIEPIGFNDILLAHSRAYVDLLLFNEEEVLKEITGSNVKCFSNLMSQVGCYYQATKNAYESNINTISLTTGGHHAGYDFGRGFCALNTMMISLLKLRLEYPNVRVGILDLDAHLSDGIMDIIKQLSIENIQLYSFGYQSIGKSDKEKWLVGLEELLKNFKDCDLILYHAGADPHEADLRYSGFLSGEDLFYRDQTVYRFFKTLKIPISTCFGGSYQNEPQYSKMLYMQTIEACSTV